MQSGHGDHVLVCTLPCQTRGSKNAWKCGQAYSVKKMVSKIRPFCAGVFKLCCFSGVASWCLLTHFVKCGFLIIMLVGCCAGDCWSEPESVVIPSCRASSCSWWSMIPVCWLDIGVKCLSVFGSPTYWGCCCMMWLGLDTHCGICCFKYVTRIYIQIYYVYVSIWGTCCEGK